MFVTYYQKIETFQKRESKKGNLIPANKGFVSDQWVRYRNQTHATYDFSYIFSVRLKAYNQSKIQKRKKKENNF